ncbi:MAG: polysaccharide biosynthesis tyrosine autokinase [Fibrobacteres bacterium]|nr:polysaccharide biosynthesis tyrosine autokinase [Fibrobacterota bacterium]
MSTRANDDLPEQPEFKEDETERIHDVFTYAEIEPKPEPVIESKKSEAVAKVRVTAETKHVPHPDNTAAKKSFVPFKKNSDDLDFLKYLSVLVRRRRILIIAIAGFVMLGLIKSVGVIDQFQAETKLLIQLKQQNPVGQFDPGYFWDRQTKINTMLNTLKSREVLQRVLDRLQMHLTPGALGARITALRVQETNIIKVTASSEIPEEAALIANTLAQVFVEFNSELNRKDIADALSYIERQITSTEKELREKEDALKIFVENNKVAGSEEGSGTELSKLSELEGDLRNTTIQIVENDEKLSRIRQLLKDLKIYVEESYTFDNSLESGLIQHNIDLANTLAEYGEQHYKVKQIKEKIRQITELARKNQEGNVQITSTKSLNQNRQSLLSEHNNLTVLNNAAKAKKQALETVLKEASARFTQIPAIQLEYHRLKRDKLNIEQVYQLLQTKYQEQRIRYEMQSADVVQWEVATIPKSAVPQGSKFGILVFVLVGLIVGAGLAFAIEFLDQSVKNPQEVEDELGIPILGIIPLMDADSKVIDIESKSSILEPYRSLRTNIRYTNMDAKKRVILVTSAIQGDGKTTKVCNLAISFALDGKSVMVIDGDLRRANVHKVLGVEKEPGLSDYLSKQATLEQIERKIFDGMIAVVPAGKRPPNPAELLGNHALADVIKWGLEHYDLVLVDSPAIVPVSDALLLVPHVDSTIIIGRSMKTPKKAMQYAKNSLTRAGANIIGAVFNGVEQRGGYYPYYYSYYSYYSYYKSKYYYYDDDSEMEKLPKNMKEFLVYSVRQFAVEQREFFKGRYKAVTGFLFGKEHTFQQKLSRIGIALAVVAALGLILYKPLFKHRTPRGDLPENYRFIPLAEGTRAPVSYKPSNNWLASSAVADRDHSKLELRRMVEQWRAAWESGNSFEYRKYYSPTRFMFKYGGYREWISLKDSAFANFSGLKVSVDSLRFMQISDSDAVVSFYQGYAPDSISDYEFSWKQLKWYKEHGLWKITREGREQ